MSSLHRFKQLVKFLLNEVSSLTINVNLFEIKNETLHPGTAKKVVSFCLFGIDPKYFSNIDACLQSYAQFLPEWKIRVYVSADLPAKVIDKFRKHNCELVIMKRKGIDFRYTFWRFLVLDDQNVAYALVRDIDSIASTREKLMVNQWMDSQKLLHVIRDHPDHTDVIMAGLFGRRFDANFQAKKAMLKFKKLNKLGVDQEFLKKLYTHYFPNLLAHDIFHRYPNEQPVMIPHDNYNTFIGEINSDHQHRQRDRNALAQFYLKTKKIRSHDDK